MKYLVIGSGGREHAIAWRLLQDGSASEVYVAPGNGGIDDKYRVNIQSDDFDGIAKFSRDNNIHTVIVGPEAPLAGGIIDFLSRESIRAFGPSKSAAQLEGSKLFAKRIMDTYKIPTCRYHEFFRKSELLDYIEKVTKYPVVIKLDGLAAGKGVGIPNNKMEALAFISEMITGDVRVLVEDFLEGEEASILGISDGDDVKMLISAQDHKRIYDGDKGPNTGGMGAYSPAPIMTDMMMKRVHREILKPTVEGMKKEGIPFKGVLYAGLMISGDTINVLEFNVRFGDPEIQAILPLLKGKFGDILQAAIDGKIGSIDIEFSTMHSITVVMASGGYPGDYEKSKKITGLENISDNIIVFQAGTKKEKGILYTNGGRVLNVTGFGESIFSARDRVYREIKKISFEGAQYRNDIAYRALK